MRSSEPLQSAAESKYAEFLDESHGIPLAATTILIYEEIYVTGSVFVQKT